MNHVYESEKHAHKDARVFLGYSQAGKLSAPAKQTLVDAERRLAMLSSRDLMKVFLEVHQNGLSFDKPPREALMD